MRNTKPLANYICTSSALKCKESKGSNKSSNANEEKKESAPEVVSSEEEKKMSSASSGNAESIKKSKSKKQSKRHSKTPDGKTLQKGEFKTDFFRKIFVSSAESVAEDLGGNKKETKQDLLDYIRTFEVSKEKEETAPTRFVVRPAKVSYGSTKKLFENARGLNIFHRQIMEAEGQVELKTWNKLEAEHLEYLGLKSPRNHFEELIQWTNEGKLWQFPIDNDQGLEEEAKVSFTEHIFMEQYLEPWCPKRGPLRKFMELVLIGLSKNPYLTVEEKREHIKWFENYFESKKKLLQELGAVGATKELDGSNQEHS